jgi:hypothetical protein
MSKGKAIHEPTSAAQRTALDRQRRAADRIDELPDGFTLKPHGRDGVVYYRENGRVLELPYEMDGTQPGILLYVDGLEAWVLPGPQPTSPSDRERIRGALEHWANQHRGTVTFVSSSDLIRPWESEER